MQSQDFNSMQSQAIRYALEMQRRASPGPEQNSRRGETQFHKQPQIPPPQNNGQSNRRGGFNPLKNLLGIFGGNGGADNDILLIAALMLVLASDGGDRMLMLALLYIMS